MSIPAVSLCLSFFWRGAGFASCLNHRIECSTYQFLCIVSRKLTRSYIDYLSVIIIDDTSFQRSTFSPFLFLLDIFRTCRLETESTVYAVFAESATDYAHHNNVSTNWRKHIVWDTLSVVAARRRVPLERHSIFWKILSNKLSGFLAYALVSGRAKFRLVCKVRLNYDFRITPAQNLSTGEYIG